MFNEFFTMFGMVCAFLGFFVNIKVFVKNLHAFVFVGASFLLCSIILGVGASGLIYGATLYFVNTSLFEKYLIYKHDFRRIATLEEKKKLLKLFAEVKALAIREKMNICKKTKCYMTDEAFPSAYALGGRTIAVTRGAIKTLSDRELKGIMLHELGHLHYEDTRAKNLILYGNGFFSMTLFTWEFVLRLFSLVPNMGGFTSFINLVFNILVGSASLGANLILAMVSRKKEYKADLFLHDKENADILGALIKLQKYSFEAPREIKEKLLASHPNMAYRIERLEKSLKEESIKAVEDIAKEIYYETLQGSKEKEKVLDAETRIEENKEFLFNLLAKIFPNQIKKLAQKLD